MRRVVGWALVAGLVGTGCTWKAELVPPAAATAQSSKLFAADGSLLATLHAEEHRESVPLDQLPDHLVDAVVAIEDERFWQHKGVDVQAILRAAWTDASSGRVEEGGSTITQQYVKNAILGSERSLNRKVREAALAYQLERRYRKELILERYLNTIYFGNGAYGAEAAAQTYFGVKVQELTLAQAALLAGVIRAPTDYDPYDHPEAARARRQVVLDQLVRLDQIDEAEAKAAAGEPLGVLAEPPEDRYPAPYFVEVVKRFILDDPRFGASPAARRSLLFTGGLRIATTLDRARQEAAEAAVAEVLTRPNDPLAAVVAVEPATGFVQALVGGRDFFGGGAQAKFDLATHAPGRHAGSAFKPFILAQALIEGIPLDKVYRAPARLEIPLEREVWEIDNYGEGGYGALNLVDATTKSVNTVYAQLIMDVGPEDAIALARRLGIGSGEGAVNGEQEPRPRPAALAAFPSAVLGTNDVTPLDMAVAYAAFPNRGVAVEPVFVTRVTKADGTVLYQHAHAQRRVLPTGVADTVNAVLRLNVEAGTGTAAQIGRPAAGKTGTAQAWRNAWFVGYTPELTTAVWLGYGPIQHAMVPPLTPVRVTGGSYPAQIWQRFMSRALGATPPTDFAPPPPPQDPAAATLPGAPPLPPPALRTVPNVVGLPYGAALSRLGRAGFAVDRRFATNPAYPPGYVVEQSPPPNAAAPPASLVVVVVSEGPAEESAPAPP